MAKMTRSEAEKAKWSSLNNNKSVRGNTNTPALDPLRSKRTNYKYGGKRKIRKKIV